jgi:hypothetical protein
VSIALLRGLTISASLWIVFSAGTAQAFPVDFGPGFATHTPTLWHFRSVGPTPLALIAGRESTYFNYFWNDFAADKKRSLSESSRLDYIAAYSRPGRMASGWAYFAAFPKTASDFAVLAKTRLKIPVLSIGGDKSLGVALGAQAKLIASYVTIVVLKIRVIG